MLFTVLQNYDYHMKPEEQETAKEWVADTLDITLDSFQFHIVRGERVFNYLHLFKCTVLDLLKEGGFWKYATDSQETFNSIFKSVAQDFTNHAGGVAGNGKHWTESGMERIYLRFHMFVTSGQLPAVLRRESKRVQDLTSCNDFVQKRLEEERKQRKEQTTAREALEDEDYVQMLDDFLLL